MKDEKIEIKFELEELTNKFILHLKEITDCLTNIYYAVEASNIDIHKPLPTDSFPIVIDDKKSKPTISEQKQKTLNWVLIKAFEEFINGLTKSLKETYRYLKFHTLSLELRYPKTREEFDKEFQKIENDIEKFHFPDFIEKIEKLLNNSLPYKDEILSINKIRNCFVYRDGVVGEKDIKNSSTTELCLKWISLKYWTKIDGQQTEITYDLRKNGITVNNLSYKTIKNEKSFKLGDQILLDINEFNGIAYTCSAFANGLFSLMPKQDKMVKEFLD